jgi:hypothetical protein
VWGESWIPAVCAAAPRTCKASSVVLMVGGVTRPKPARQHNAQGPPPPTPADNPAKQLDTCYNVVMMQPATRQPWAHAHRHTPAMWLARCRKVMVDPLVPSNGSYMTNPGQCFTSGSSRCTTPAAASRVASSEVKAFVMEHSRYTVSVVAFTGGTLCERPYTPLAMVKFPYAMWY